MLTISTYVRLIFVCLISFSMVTSCSNQTNTTNIQADMIGFWKASNSATDYLLFYEINEEGMTVWSDQLDGFLSLNYQVRSDSLFLNIVNSTALNSTWSFSGLIDFVDPSAFSVENMDQTLSFRASTREAFSKVTGKEWQAPQ